MRLILGFVFLMGSAAFASDWQNELADYEQTLTERNRLMLSMSIAKHSSMAALTCSADVMIVAATALADTMPAFNLVSESMANMVDEGYSTLDHEGLLELLSDTGRGFSGGAIVGVAESMEFVFLWLSGNEDQSFQALAQIYQSTAATAEALFAEQGKCMMSISKLMLNLKEWEAR